MARFLKYLEARGLAQTANRKVWVFCGDGEMDEPESLGAIGLASREKLDNLIFIVNCNLQRLDGPVRGNGKIIQELEGEFRGAGWNVIKVIWGSYWDPLLARDKDGALLRVMEETVDGEYQNYKANDGALRAQALLRQAPEGGRAGRAHERRGHLAPEPRRPRSAQGLRGVRGGGEAQGPAHGDPRQDHQGLRPGQAGPGQEPDAPAEEDRHRDHQGDARPVRHPDPGRQARRAAVLHSAGRRAGDEVPARAAQGARRLPAAAAREGRSGSRGPALECLRAAPEGLGRRPRDLHHHGVRARAHGAGARQGARQDRGADRARRGAHLRHGRHVPPARHLRARGPEVRAGRQGPGDVLPRGQAGPDPRGRHQRGGRVLLVDRRGDLVQPFQRA